MRNQALALCLLAALAACSRGAPKTDAPLTASSSAPAASASAAPIAEAPASAAAPPVDARSRAPSREGSTVALARTGDALYVADEDHAFLHRLALPLGANDRPLPIPMPGQPAQVLALADRVLVTIRSAGAVPPGKEPAASDAPPAAPDAAAPEGAPIVPSSTGPGLLLVLRPDADQGLVEIARVELPRDAWGIAVTPDASLALVTSAWTHQVSAVDLATYKVRWSLAVAREPRAVVVRADGRAAYVTHLTQAKLTRIDDLAGPPKARSVNLPAAPLHRPALREDPAGATLAYAAVLSPDGRRLFVPRHSPSSVGRKAWFGVSSVDVLLTQDDASLAPLHRDELVGFVDPPAQEVAGYGVSADVADPQMALDANPTPFAQPRAAVYLERRRSLLVLSEGWDLLSEHDALAVDPAMHTLRSYRLSRAGDPGNVATDCGAPSGIALSPDERTAWIHCRSTGALLAVDLDADDSAPRTLVRLAGDLLPPVAALGRRLFYNGSFGVTSGGLGCAGCHPEGRDDGQVWLETTGAPPARGRHPTFVSTASVAGLSEDRPARPLGVNETLDSYHERQTPMLAGRVSAEGPYGWHGESRTLTDRLVAGFQLHRWDEPQGSGDERALAEALAAFVRRGLVPPPREARALTAKEQRGREVFASDEALCWTCHKPDREYTDRANYAALPAPEKLDEFTDPDLKFKTPSLRFVAGTPPYFHDGSAETLADLVEHDKDTMGKVSHLSAEDRAALVAFLETL